MTRILLVPAFVLAILAAAAHAQPLTTAFTFQGNLANAGAPATGNYDLRFRLYDAAATGIQQGPTLCANDITAA